VEKREARRFEVAAADLESLLVDWLNEVNFAFEVDRFAFREFHVASVAHPAAGAAERDGTKAGASLSATGFGEPLDPQRHHPGEQVKSVTYHGVKIERTPDGWVARVFLDV
jgi:SHS2 domain-containing protein